MFLIKVPLDKDGNMNFGCLNGFLNVVATIIGIVFVVQILYSLVVTIIFIFSDGQKTEMVAENEQFVEQTPVDTSSISIKPQNVAVVKPYSIIAHLDSILLVSREKDVRLDYWYQSFPSALEEMKSLVEQNKYQEVISMYESDSIQAIIWLYNQCIIQNWIHPDKLGLSEQSAQKFKENAPKQYTTLIRILIDMFEKEAKDNGYFYSIETYMEIFNDSHLYNDSLLLKIAKSMVDNTVNYVAIKTGKQSLVYANVLYIQAKIYRDDKEKAIKILQETKLIYELANMKNYEEWQNCTDLLDELMEIVRMPESSLFHRLTLMEERKIDTKLQYNSIFVESIPFSEGDWETIKKGYNRWRKEEIAKGNYQEKCPDISNQDDKDYSDRLSMNALPEIPAKFHRNGEIHYGSEHINTLMADINFDGKLDVVFKIDQGYCMGGVSYYMPLPTTIYLSFISEEYGYQIDNKWTISKAVEAISQFNYEVGDEHIFPKGIFVSSIVSKDGVIIVSGNSITAEHIENNTYISDDDSNCCPSYRFNYDFHYYIETSGKGYADIDGIYRNKRKETQKRFIIKY